MSTPDDFGEAFVALDSPIITSMSTILAVSLLVHQKSQISYEAAQQDLACVIHPIASAVTCLWSSLSRPWHTFLVQAHVKLLLSLCSLINELRSVLPKSHTDFAQMQIDLQNPPFADVLKVPLSFEVDLRKDSGLVLQASYTQLGTAKVSYTVQVWTR